MNGVVDACVTCGVQFSVCECVVDDAIGTWRTADRDFEYTSHIFTVYSDTSLHVARITNTVHASLDMNRDHRPILQSDQRKSGTIP